MISEQRYPGDNQPEEDEIPDEVECISLEGFEVVKRGDMLHIRKKENEQEEK